MTREEMMNEIIRMYGHESQVTIAFCTLCENPRITDNNITLTYKQLHKEACPND